MAIPATVDQKATAYSLFMQTDKTYAQIGEEIGLKPTTIRQWVKDGQWKKKKDEVLGQRMADVDQALKDAVGEPRMEFLKRHLDICRLIEERVQFEIGKRVTKGDGQGNLAYLDTKEFRDLIHAFKMSSDRASKILGLDHEVTNPRPEEMIPLEKRRLVLVGIVPEDVPAGSLPAAHAPIEPEEVDITDDIDISSPHKARPF